MESQEREEPSSLQIYISNDAQIWYNNTTFQYELTNFSSNTSRIISNGQYSSAILLYVNNCLVCLYLFIWKSWYLKHNYEIHWAS